MPAQWREGGRAGPARGASRPPRAPAAAPEPLPVGRVSAEGAARARARLDAWQGFGYQGRDVIIETREELWLSTLPAVTPPWTILSICGPTPVSSRPPWP